MTYLGKILYKSIAGEKSYTSSIIQAIPNIITYHIKYYDTGGFKLYEY